MDYFTSHKRRILKRVIIIDRIYLFAFYSIQKRIDDAGASMGLFHGNKMAGMRDFGDFVIPNH